MGLGLSVAGISCGRWSYSGFNSFRERLAKQAGIVLNNMEGFSSINKDFLKTEGWEAYRKAYEEDLLKDKISWDTINDPIKILLNHSDCDGEIAPENCLDLAARLEELIKDWPQETILDTKNWKGYPEAMIFNEYDYVQASELIKGLMRAVEINKPVEFH